MLFDKNLLKQLKKIKKIHNTKIEIEKRIEENLKKVKLSEEEINILDETTKKFFPNSGRWSSSEFARDESCLLCHLRDDYWLANKLKEKIELQNNNLKIDLYKVLKYVKESSKFSYEKHSYEQKVVKWQIIFILNPHSEGWICNEKYGGDLMRMSPNCDIGFRQAVKDTLLAVGMNEEAIEEGLVKNSNLWLDKMIEQAFLNKYDNLLWNSNFLGKNKGIIIPPAANEHKESWMLLRKCQYYEQYQENIIKYGNKEWLEIIRSLPKQDERAELQLKVERLNNIRKAEIEEYKQRRQNIESKIYKQKMITKGV